jgi:RNA polymerase sigma-70 factor (ECF subfamily)
MDREDEIRRHLEAGDLRQAATKTIEAFGPEVLGFLCAVIGQEQDAYDVFSQACEDLWRGIPQFQRRSTIRAWFYALARHAGARWHRSPHRRPAYNAPLSSDAREIAERVRSQTQPHLQTGTKDWFTSTRQMLSEDDRALLVLRVDRDLNWTDIARVFSPDDASEGNLARTSARLRKRFQLLKEEIRLRARKAGLLGGER